MFKKISPVMAIIAVAGTYITTPARAQSTQNFDQFAQDAAACVTKLNQYSHKYLAGNNGPDFIPASSNNVTCVFYPPINNGSAGECIVNEGHGLPEVTKTRMGSILAKFYDSESEELAVGADSAGQIHIVKKRVPGGFTDVFPDFSFANAENKTSDQYRLHYQFLYQNMEQNRPSDLAYAQRLVRLGQQLRCE